MRKIVILGLVGVLALFLAGCGGGGNSEPVVTTFIDSDLTLDADLTLDLVGGGTPLLALASTNGNVLAGVTVDPGGTPVADTRGFLIFPLSSVPLNASIRFASVTVFLNQVTLGISFLPTPFFIDLIDTTAFPPPVQPTDYSVALAATRTFDFINSDQGKLVEIVVTSLMQEAQARGLPSFEVRLGFDEDAFNADINTTRGLVEIDDRVLAPSQRPFLTVDYVN